MEKVAWSLILSTFVVLGRVPPTLAQHEAHHPTASSERSTNMGSGHALAPGDLKTDPIGVLMRRMALQGSGTSLQPESSPMWMWMRDSGPWLWRIHGQALLSWNGATGPRGYGEVSLPNWAMIMGSRVLGPGILDLRAMASLDPLTTPPGGTPQLFQTGETFRGLPLIDRQHPHDLFMELAGLYTLPLATGTSLFLYGGPVGEPALGPNAYMHRASAADNAMVPISHHLQDSTHITMGVLSAGLQWNRWQLEGSWFRGREPDENRWDLDLGALDSYSGRLSYAPSPNWTMQVSSGYLSNPEALKPGDLIRSTASLHYNRPLSFGNWANALVWGQNRKLAERPPEITNSLLLESSLDWAERNHAYGRYELVDKEGLVAGVPGETEVIHRLHAFTIGAIRDLSLEPVVIGVGADITLYAKPTDLDPVYGSAPISYRAFIRVRPPLMRHRTHQAVHEGRHPPVQRRSPGFPVDPAALRMHRES